MKTEFLSAKSKEAHPVDTAQHVPTSSDTGLTKFGKLHDVHLVQRH